MKHGLRDVEGRFAQAKRLGQIPGQNIWVTIGEAPVSLLVFLLPSPPCWAVSRAVCSFSRSCYKDGTRVYRFAPIGTAEEVLKPEILYRFFRSLQLPQIGTDSLNLDLDVLVQMINERGLYTFLAILIFTECQGVIMVRFINRGPANCGHLRERTPITYLEIQISFITVT
jgi:hypothetical protein